MISYQLIYVIVDFAAASNLNLKVRTGVLEMQALNVSELSWYVSQFPLHIILSHRMIRITCSFRVPCINSDVGLRESHLRTWRDMEHEVICSLLVKVVHGGWRVRSYLCACGVDFDFEITNNSLQLNSTLAVRFFRILCIGNWEGLSQFFF